ncbi:hypothetical protein HAX54_017601 [Datura stramonium]|uniref:C-JID domain-containing protein n=1 Tax=Datura stramonium TaxID=4076 RepID=A0ABS8S0R8_DATST|nr:hypothetical protein [Datura stramonium]
MPNVKNLIKRSDGERKKPQAARPSLSGLHSLKKLDLSDSDLVDEIAADVWHLASLEELNLSRNNFVQFPSRVSGLPELKVLKLEECKSLEVLPDLPLNIAVIEADECPALHSLGNLSPQHAFLRKVSFFNCFKLYNKPENWASIIYGRFSILQLLGKIPEWFDHQKIGGSLSVQLPSDWQDNIVRDFIVEYTFESAPSAASKMGEVYETDHLWITYISFNLFRLLFPDFTAEDWTKVCGCLAIRVRQDPWTKVRRCGVKVVYKQDLSTLAAERAGLISSESKELVVYEGGGLETKEEGIKEDIAALMAGVTELNWDVDPIEQDNTQLMNLRKSAAYKIQKTLSFEC